MSISTVITQGYGSFSAAHFVVTLGYGQVAPVTVISIDTHDGFDGKKHKKREEKERLHNQIEEAFYAAFGGRPVISTTPAIVARNDEPLVEFVFPAYHEIEDDEDAELLLLT